MRHRGTSALATDVLSIIGNIDELPSIGHATPEQLEALGKLSRKRFCLLYFKSACVFITLVFFALLTWKSGHGIDVLLHLFNITNTLP